MTEATTHTTPGATLAQEPLHHALALAASGHAVFPLKPNAKTPATNHGVKDASTDPNTIRSWWRQWPRANIGIALPDGMLAVDIDVKDVDGHATLAALAAPHGGLPTTLTTETTTGGQHLFFKKPPDVRVKNRANVQPGIDVRAQGGYVVAPPSTLDGKAYRWLNDTAPADCPQWLLDVLVDEKKPPIAPAPPLAPPQRPADAYAQRALDRAIASVLAATEGGRNDNFNAAAYGLARLAGAGRLDWHHTAGLLERAALASGLEPAEVRKTLDSAWAAGQVAPNYEGLPGQHGQRGNAGFEPLQEDDTDQKNARPSFKFVPIGSLLKSPQPVSFLVDELIEHPSLGLVFGPHSCGKSFVTLSMAACVATGTPWMERDVTPGAVFYLAGEGHAGIARRLMGWSAHSGVSLDGAPLFVSEVPAKLMDAQAAADVILAIEAMTSEFGRPALIVIDTFHRNMGGGDENSNSDIGIFISHIDGMRARTGATVLLVHHSGHNPESQDRGRGASAMGAAMDCILQVSKEDDAITLISRKTKESETPPPLRLELRHPVALPADWIDAKCRPMTTAVAVLSHAPAPAKTKRLTPAQQLALTTYRESACEAGEWDAEAETVRVHLDDWRKVFYEKSTADSPDAKRTAFNTARKELVGRGLLSVMNDFYAMKASDSILQAAKFAHEMTKKDSEAPKRSEANRSTS